MGQDVLDAWFGKLRLMSAWGPTEMCVVGSVHEFEAMDESPLVIGRPVACRAWIVDPQDPLQARPGWLSGELVVQGQETVFRGYLSDPGKTRLTALESYPTWAGKDNSHHRFYRTGDLCFYRHDGAIQYGCRKDMQVKVRGLRVELGEDRAPRANLLGRGATSRRGHL